MRCVGQLEELKEKGVDGDVCQCNNEAGQGTSHPGFGYCKACERGRTREECDEMAVKHEKLVLDGHKEELPVLKTYEALLMQEVNYSEQQQEINRALQRAKGILEDMAEEVTDFRDRLGAGSEGERVEALNAIAEALKETEFIDPEQGRELQASLNNLLSGGGLTERGKEGPIALSDDTRYKLSATLNEQMRRNAETIAKIARDSFDVGKDKYVEKSLLKRLLVPGLLDIIRELSEGNPQLEDMGIEKLHRLFMQVDEESKK